MMRLKQRKWLVALGLVAVGHSALTIPLVAQTPQYASQPQQRGQHSGQSQQYSGQVRQPAVGRGAAATGQQYTAQQQQQQYTAQQQQQQRARQQQQQQARQGGTPPGGAAPQRPFPPLSNADQAKLNQVLLAWEKQSQNTRTLQCKFDRWHFDLQAAPAGVHAAKATGVIKYAAPDRGLFKVETLVHYNGMQDGKPQFVAKPGLLGEHWVCNGREVIEFDHGKKRCRVLELPSEMQGKEIFNSPLPFVFNLNARQIQQRYWVRQVAAPKPDVVVIEAWPKQAKDRAQYRLVQIALSEGTFLPQALLMYAPNFDAKTAPNWDHYEFSSVGRNGVGQRLNLFMKNFIPEQPPADWEFSREKYTDPAAPQSQAAPPQQRATRPQPAMAR